MGLVLLVTFHFCLSLSMNSFFKNESNKEKYVENDLTLVYL